MRSILNSMMENAILGNAFHILLALIYGFSNVNHVGISWIFMILILIVWMISGFRFAVKAQLTKESNIISYAIVSLIPIITLLTASQLMQGLKALSHTQSYSMFYFIGAPVILWNRPLEPFMSLFKDSGIYIQFDINIVLIFFMIFIGGFLGMQFKGKNKEK